MMKYLTDFGWPSNYIYISHLDKSLEPRLMNEPNTPPQYWWLPCCPQTIQDSMSSSFAPTSALGRSAPVQTYQGSGPRTVQIEIQLHRDMMDTVNANNTAVTNLVGEDYVDSLIRALQSISVPKYNLSNKAVEPPLVALRLSNEVFIKGIVSGDIGITYEMPIISGDRYAQVRLSITVTEVDPYDASSVYKNGSFRGVVRTLSNGMKLASF